MSSSAQGGRFVTLHKLSVTLSRRIRELKRIYSGLCSSGTRKEPETFFADNFHTVLSLGATPEKRRPKRLVYFTGRFELADAVIDSCDTALPDAETVVMTLRSAISKRRVYGCELEYLRFTVIYALIEKILACLKAHDRSLIRYMSILSDLGSLDAERINDILNPVAIKLSADKTYLHSDPKTRLIYREAIYQSADRFGLDEIKLCDDLLEKYRGKPLDIQSLAVLNSAARPESAAALYAFGIAAAAAIISTVIAYFADAPLMALLLFLPATEAVRPISDIMLKRGRLPSRLMRLDLRSEEVRSAKTAIVLSAAVSDPGDAVTLYDRLLRLHCSNPAENILICALIDLSPEQVPISSEDRAVIETVSETVSKLNKKAPGRFSALIRKRTYSETQQEYMGAYRKRGALTEAAKFMTTGEGDFYATLGAYESLKGTEYICAVDIDTSPLMDSVSELLSVALHPLNKAEIKNGRVVRGYGIIAPRILTRLQDSLRSEFSKSLGGVGSRSSYDEESSDLYQDVFGSGTFCGKGLINAEALAEIGSTLSGERILSHDILEGELLKTAYAGDICFTEGFPKSPQSYYRRLDRWIRGDFQNLPEIFSNKYGVLSKLKLLDNLRRAAIPPIVFTAFFCGFFLYPVSAAIIAGAALGLWLLPPAIGTLITVIRGGAFGRRFYSGLISSASQSLRYILYSIVMLPTLAVKSLRAIMTALTRLMTRRRLLEWTTSDASDRAAQNPFVFYLLPELLSLSLLGSPDYFIRLAAAVFSMMPALLAVGGPAPGGETQLKYRDLRELSKQTADMWGFFEGYVTRRDNYLPPDNVQFSPVYRVAHRTSPTNIGLYMLSTLAAYDRRLITLTGLTGRISDTLGTLLRMKKYRGNLYNWYDTETLEICPRPYVSSVDSGNFICCLVALKEGLAEIADCPEIPGLILKIEKLISSADFSAFYDPVRGLMAIGIEPETGDAGRAHYDYLMSEARLTSFWAIASRQVPKSHWQRLARPMLSCGFFGGAASYSGTMFEYYMPEIFLKSPEGSLLCESLRYALWVQRRYASSLGRPFGISESGCFSFDSALNYRYSAHGVPNTGMRRGLDQSYVVSPYSTYISLCFSGGDGVENLRKLTNFGMYGSFGFYEALDFTAPDSEKPEPVRSYMAHHVGMSILSCDNILSGGIMQKRFMRDMRVRGALELLDERFHLGAAVFENDLRRPKTLSAPPKEIQTEVMSEFCLTSPKMKILHNGEMTLTIADNGACASIYRSENVIRRTRDLLRRPEGIFSFISDGGPAVSLSFLPDMTGGVTAEFSEDSATFYRNTEKLAAGMKIRLHSDLPCELRSFAVKNLTSEPLKISLINYIDPSLQEDSAEGAHPAYSKMFLRFEKDPEWDIVTATRVNGGRGIYLAVGFIEDVKKTVSFDREEVLSRPEGIYGIGKSFNSVPPSLISEPDPCIYIKAGLELPPRADAEITMFYVCADSREELINRVSSLRRKKPRYSLLPRLDTAPGRVASMLLPKIMFGGALCGESEKAIIENRLPLRSLWELSISTELPLVLVILNGRGDAQKLSAYLGAYKLLRLCGIGLQMVFAFDDGGRYEREHYTDLITAARNEGLEGSVYSSGGILPLDISKAREGLYGLCRAYACHICTDELVPEGEKPPESEYKKILPSEADVQGVDTPASCGGFNGDSYVINEKPPLPWCHVLSNPVFGTLLSEGSLGFTYAFNSRENRLTPWDNDPARDNIGEMLLLDTEDGTFDIIRGAAAVFSPYKAEYFADVNGFKAKTTVRVSAKGMCKRIDVEINRPGRLCLYTEPCMGVDRRLSRLILPSRAEKGLILSSPAAEIQGYMYIGCSEKCGTMTDREAFLSGLRYETVKPSGNLCGAVFCDVESGKKLSFYIAYALDKRAAGKMPELFCAQTDTRERAVPVITDDKNLNRLMNVWLRYQALHARIWARTGFWQCSGAYGFRDQLQDAAGIVCENPGTLKSQILRCCRAQFKEGDVLHWWHSLPGQKSRGIRTRISDDALWLPYALCEYIDKTKDMSILGLSAAYCDGLSLKENENERYGEVYRTALRESVYLHCRRAIDFRIGKTGRHGLMLIGSGDWNDGFGNVGRGGEGESVWLTEFFIIVLRRFSRIAVTMSDAEYSKTLADFAENLANACEKEGRDRAWYLRGYFDGGSPLGSEKCAECRIDSIAQSFAEFSGLGADGFTVDALKCAYNELADQKRGIIKLFSPAFSVNADPDPGYVKFYPEGMRENGGQYTHAAVWFGMALIKAGLLKEGEAVLRALNPIAKSQGESAGRYKTEPYYLCGDVYSNKNCCGRGGWSVYTGSAAWYYRALRESLCGLRPSGGGFCLQPGSPIAARLGRGAGPTPCS